MWARPLYRARQFFLGLRPSLTPSELAIARRLLSEPELVLFNAMQPRDRRHSMDMVHWLREHTAPSDRLLAAALLHDVAKRHLRVWDRVAFVLIVAVSMRLLDTLASEHGRGTRRALWVLRHHASLGASMLEQTGTPEQVVELVRRHKDAIDTLDPARDEELRWLIRADGAC